MCVGGVVLGAAPKTATGKGRHLPNHYCPTRETGSGEIIHHLSTRVTSLPDAPFCGSGRDPQCWPSHIRPGKLRNQLAGPAPAGPPSASLPTACSRRFAFRPHRPLTPPLPGPPRLPPRAPGQPALPDLHSVPCSPLRSSRISQGSQYLLAPIPGGASPPPRFQNTCPSAHHHDPCPRLPTGSPQRGQRDLPSGFIQDKTPDPNSWGPSLRPNFQAQLGPGSPSLRAQKGCSLLLQRLPGPHFKRFQLAENPALLGLSLPAKLLISENAPSATIKGVRTRAFLSSWNRWLHPPRLPDLERRLPTFDFSLLFLYSPTLCVFGRGGGREVVFLSLVLKHI